MLFKICFSIKSLKNLSCLQEERVRNCKGFKDRLIYDLQGPINGRKR